MFEAMILAMALDATDNNNNGATPHNPRQEGVCDALWGRAETAEAEEVEAPEVEA